MIPSLALQNLVHLTAHHLLAGQGSLLKEAQACHRHPNDSVCIRTTVTRQRTSYQQSVQKGCPPRACDACGCASQQEDQEVSMTDELHM